MSEPTLSKGLKADKLHSYIANGITLQSEIEFPELQLTNRKPEVLICIGEVPKNIENAIYEGPCSQAGKNEYLLQVRNVATYYLEKKGEQFTIAVSPVKGVSISEIRIFILSSMLGAVCHMKRLLPLHASGVVINGKAVLFCGKSGLGKSTLCAALHQKGCAFITDNIAAIYADESGELMVHPSYSHLRLWQDSISALHLEGKKGIKMREEVDKLNLILEEGIQEEAIPVGKIYHLNQGFSNDIEITALSGRKKSDIVVRETFRAKLLKAIGSQSAYFSLLNQICASVDIAQIHRPVDAFLIEELSEAIFDDLNSKTD